MDLGDDGPGRQRPDPPEPPGYTLPIDAVWGLPQDVLPQHVDLVPGPTCGCARKARVFASPGDTISYAITVGNSGEAAAEEPGGA